MKHEHLIRALAMVALLVAIGAAVAKPLPRGGGSLSMGWHTIDAGGGTSSADSLVLSGTIGQPDAATSTGGQFALKGGFWVQPAGGRTTCAEDLTGDGAIDVADLVAVISGWGTPAGDTNGDGLTDVQDLLAVIIGWGFCS